MFKERYLVFRGGAERPNDRVKENALDFGKKRADLSGGLADSLLEKNIAVYEKAVGIFMSMGMDRKKGEEMVEDSTNPFLPDLMDFLEKMDHEKWVVNKDSLKGGDIGFTFQGKPALAPVLVMNALHWGSKIYPGLKKYLEGSYSQKFAEVAVFYDLYGMKNIVGSLRQSFVPTSNYIEWAKWELRQLKDGVSPKDLVKIEKEKFGEKKKEDVKTADQPKTSDKAISESERAAKMKEAGEELAKKTSRKFEKLVAKYGDEDNRKNLTETQIKEVRNDVRAYVRDLEGISPAVNRFMNDEAVDSWADNYLSLLKSGVSDEERDKKLGKADSALSQRYEDEFRRAEESEDYDELVAMDSLNQAFNYFGHISRNFYLKEKEE